jgi:hypothetical protein
MDARISSAVLVQRKGLHFHVTVTVPAELPDVMRRHQRDAYGLLMGATAAGDHRARP